MLVVWLALILSRDVPVSGSTTVYLDLGCWNLPLTREAQIMEVTNSSGPCCFHLREGERGSRGEKDQLEEPESNEIRLITHIPLCCKLFTQGGYVCRYTFTRVSARMSPILLPKACSANSRLWIVWAVVDVMMSLSLCLVCTCTWSFRPEGRWMLGNWLRSILIGFQSCLLLCTGTVTDGLDIDKLLGRL